MAIPTAGNIMDSAAALLNDTAKQIYTYTAQLPYLKIALAELRDEFALAGMQVTNQTSAVINIPAGTTAVGFDTNPALPSDLIELVTVYERAEGINPFIEVPRRDFIPQGLTGTDVSTFGLYAWEGNQIKFLSSLRDNDIKLDYLRAIFTSIVDENSTLGIINGQTYLNYKCAALCAHFIGENKTRSDELNVLAAFSLGRITGIEIKAKQGFGTRRMPFRQRYKVYSR